MKLKTHIQPYLTASPSMLVAGGKGQLILQTIAAGISLPGNNREWRRYLIRLEKKLASRVETGQSQAEKKPGKLLKKGNGNAE